MTDSTFLLPKGCWCVWGCDKAHSFKYFIFNLSSHSLTHTHTRALTLAAFSAIKNSLLCFHPHARLVTSLSTLLLVHNRSYLGVCDYAYTSQESLSVDSLNMNGRFLFKKKKKGDLGDAPLGQRRRRPLIPHIHLPHANLLSPIPP